MLNRFSILFVCMAVLSALCSIGIRMAAGGDAPTMAPTVPTVEQECARLNTSCGDCVSEAKCLWCNSKSMKCIPYPVGQIIPQSDVCPLSEARWGVCWVNYEVLLITMCVLAGVILISLVTCIYCCCCRSRRSPSKRDAQEDAKYEREKEERQAKSAERRAERQVKHDEIRRKYGLMKDDTATQYSKFENEA